MKKRMKAISKVLLVITGIALLMKGSATAYTALFGPPAKTPKTKGLSDHWRSVKQSFPDMASDMDSKDIIAERQRDITT